jgi:hypothetical protein
MLTTISVVLAANPVTPNGTETHRLGAPVGRSGSTQKSKLVGAAISAGTLGNDADGTITAQIIKRIADGDTDQALTSTLSVEADGLTASEQADFTISGTDAQLTFANGDVCEIDFVNNSAAVDTQPANVIVVLEFAILE